jgi:hypothetical protein
LWKSTFALAAVACVLASSSARAADPQPDDDVEIQADTTPKPAPTPASAPAAGAAPSAPPSPSAAPTPAAEPASDDVHAEIQSLRDEVRAMKERDEAEHRPFLEIWPGDKSSTTPWEIPGREGLWLTGYMQSQYESHADSQDQLAPGGVLLNQDRFLVRRARLKLIGEWKWAATQIEINGDTTKGFNLNLHHAEATLHYRPDPTKVPVAQATLGLFDTPFGYELVESPRSRPFMERTTMSRAFWPGEPDLGVRLSGGYEFFRWTVGAVNGHPLGDKQYPGQDPIGAKDVIFRFGVDTKPRPELGIAADVSVLKGKGFHPGTDATKGTLQWTDLNEDGIVQPYELQAVPPAAATPSQTFDHWAVGADVQATYKSRFGKTKVYGEVTLAQNMDRAMFVADPVLTSIDTRELGWYVGVLQDVTEYGLVGFRYDYYDPNSDVLDKRGGKLLPFSEAIKTFSPVAGLVLPQRARLLFQYDIVRNYLARDAVGVPTNLQMNTWTLRLQVEL